MNEATETAGARVVRRLQHEVGMILEPAEREWLERAIDHEVGNARFAERMKTLAEKMKP